MYGAIRRVRAPAPRSGLSPDHPGTRRPWRGGPSDRAPDPAARKHASADQWQGPSWVPSPQPRSMIRLLLVSGGNERRARTVVAVLPGPCRGRGEYSSNMRASESSMGCLQWNTPPSTPPRCERPSEVSRVHLRIILLGWTSGNRRLVCTPVTRRWAPTLCAAGNHVLHRTRPR